MGWRERLKLWWNPPYEPTLAEVAMASGAVPLSVTVRGVTYPVGDAPIPRLQIDTNIPPISTAAQGEVVTWVITRMSWIGG